MNESVSKRKNERISNRLNESVSEWKNEQRSYLIASVSERIEKVFMQDINNKCSIDIKSQN